MARGKKANENGNNTNNTLVIDLSKVANSCKVTEKENYELREYIVTDNIKVNHYLYDNFETINIIFCNAFVVKCSVFENEQKGINYIAYPSYLKVVNENGKTKNKYINTAYPFDKAFIECLNKIVNA